MALFGGLNPLWSIVSAFLFGGLIVGGNALQVATGVPPDLVTALNGLAVVFIVSIEYMRRRARSQLLAVAQAQPDAPPEAPTGGAATRPLLTGRNE